MQLLSNNIEEVLDLAKDQLRGCMGVPKELWTPTSKLTSQRAMEEQHGMAMTRHHFRSICLALAETQSMRLQMYIYYYHQHYGTLTELSQTLGHLGYLKWDDGEVNNQWYG